MKEFPKQSDKQEKEPVIFIKRSTDAPRKLKENPFYDPEFWGRAKSADDVYLPDSDEALSFAIAAHEIGHLVKEGEILTATLDDFDATRAEEERAWQKGWVYLKKHLPDYYQADVETMYRVEDAYGKIKDLMMQAVDFSKTMYLEKGRLENNDKEKYAAALKTQRNDLLKTEEGQKILELFKKIKDQKINKKTDWERFVKIIHKALAEIIKDNNK